MAQLSTDVQLKDINGLEVNPASQETVTAIAGLVTSAYDYLAITYVAAGDGIGEIATVIFKTGGAGGTTVATLTLAYNGDDKLVSVTKT